MTPENDSAHYGIGIDTGGTYTDAVLIDLDTHHILKTAKRPTTHHDLSIGVAQALEAVTEGVDVRAIRRIAFSTTLATNAVVEGRGASVGLIVIGQVKPFDLPVVSVRYIDGGHDHTGREMTPLDLEALVDTVTGWKGEMSAYAVAAAMSIQNPAHEQVAEKAIELADPKPVFLSHRISDRPGVRERAGTAVLHARLMPVIADFIDRLKHVAAERRIRPDLTEMRMIGGDAVGIDLDKAVQRAAKTVAGGPAATAWFGAHSAAARRALVVDVGGTTTDITLIENGRPVISTDGSRIGPWRTHIDAVDMETVGIGGDSLVRVDRDGILHVGPERVRPLAASPGLPPAGEWIGVENRCKCFLIQTDAPGETEAEDQLLQALRAHGPATPAQLTARLSLSDFTLERRTAALIFRRRIAASGFTPTDALHVLGRTDIGDAEASKAGARALAAARSQSVEAFCEDLLRATRSRIRRAILDAVLRKRTGKGTAALPGFDAGDDDLLDVAFSLKVPIIGIGAAARELLPAVAESLKTQVIFPPHYAVGNALGAIMIAACGKG